MHTFTLKVILYLNMLYFLVRVTTVYGKETAPAEKKYSANCYSGCGILRNVVLIQYQVNTGSVSFISILIPILFTYKSSFCTFM